MYACDDARTYACADANVCVCSYAYACAADAFTYVLRCSLLFLPSQYSSLLRFKMYVWMYARMHVLIHVCMYACADACIYMQIHASLCRYRTCMHVS